MNQPNMQDILDLVNYTLTSDREKDDFVEQIYLGDLKPEGAKTHELLGCVDDEDAIDDALNLLAAHDKTAELEKFALLFGSSHAYPTALRIGAALNAKTEIVETEAKDGLEQAEDAYKRNVES